MITENTTRLDDLNDSRRQRTVNAMLLVDSFGMRGLRMPTGLSLTMAYGAGRDQLHMSLCRDTDGSCLEAYRAALGGVIHEHIDAVDSVVLHRDLTATVEGIDVHVHTVKFLDQNEYLAWVLNCHADMDHYRATRELCRS